ncbi:hypothetical protein AXE80_10840 [Wenyingzhuangia fucanilytica]|uniref:Uncharacterized protein n=1 Tax=Wenyingzhuangia fucanilytica TaxID=1790137 RepID=A0A1B1Y7I3_9FLAO|nr:hypothetical protein [Wenyingzhuangia fucanilytica]ANW96740.1 hypothetical protein AXE80_10840 [Wenyingzhuangia fucanilytica]
MANLPELKINISEEDIREVTRLSSLNYGPGEIAVCLGYPKKTFKRLALDPNTEIGKAYLKGRLDSKIDADDSLYKEMLKGNVTATQTHIKRSETLDFENAKAQIFDL